MSGRFRRTSQSHQGQQVTIKDQGSFQSVYLKSNRVLYLRMEVVGVVSYSHHHQTDKRMLIPTVYAKITNKVEAWIRAVAPTVKDNKGCDLT